MNDYPQGGKRLIQNAPAAQPKKKRKKKKRKAGLLIALILILAAVITVVAMAREWMSAPDLSGGKEDIPVRGESTSAQSQQDITPEGRKEGWYTVLVYGQDSVSGNTDTMLLVSLDTVNATCSMMSLPRDTIVNSAQTGANRKLNTVFKRDGYEDLAMHVSELTGVYPDFSVRVEWEVIGELVDAIGGVEYDVPYDMNYEDPTPGQELYIHLNAGVQTLNGEEAMGLIRWRKNNDGTDTSVGDEGRMEITQSFLKAVIKQVLQPRNLKNMDELITLFQEKVDTDLSVGNLAWLAGQMLNIDTETGIHTCTLPANMYGSYGGISYVFPYPAEIAEEVDAYFNPYTDEITESDLSVMALDENGKLTVTNGSLRSE